jgi:hypothetical protein
VSSTGHLSQGMTLTFFLVVIGVTGLTVLWRRYWAQDAVSMTGSRASTVLVPSTFHAAAGFAGLILLYHVFSLAEGRGWGLSVGATIAAAAVPAALVTIGVVLSVRRCPH